MFIAYFLFSAIAIFITFGLELAPQTRLAMLSMVGAGVYGSPRACAPRARASATTSGASSPPAARS
jgi:hypothetical protein